MNNETNGKWIYDITFARYNENRSVQVQIYVNCYHNFFQVKAVLKYNGAIVSLAILPLNHKLLSTTYILCSIYSQTWANDHLRITTTCLQRPLFWGPVFHVYSEKVLWATTTCQLQSQLWGPEGGCFTLVWLYIVLNIQKWHFCWEFWLSQKFAVLREVFELPN